VADYDPSQMPDLVPALTVRDPRASLAWFEKLGFHTLGTMEMPNGEIGHAHVVRKGVHVMLGPACPTTEPGATGLELYVNLRDEDVDSLCDRARQGGVTIGEEPNDKFWGDRTFQVVHPDGYRITFAKHVRNVSEQEMQDALNQWAAAEATA